MDKIIGGGIDERSREHPINGNNLSHSHHLFYISYSNKYYEIYGPIRSIVIMILFILSLNPYDFIFFLVKGIIRCYMILLIFNRNGILYTYPTINHKIMLMTSTYRLQSSSWIDGGVNGNIPF